MMVNDLLLELRKNTNAPFPKDCRAFLKTPRNVKIHEMDRGQYFHYGVTSAILTFVTHFLQKQIDLDCIKLIVNIDGAPLVKSSEKGL